MKLGLMVWFLSRILSHLIFVISDPTLFDKKSSILFQTDFSVEDSFEMT
jgi:hypothetical protein